MKRLLLCALLAMSAAAIAPATTAYAQSTPKQEAEAAQGMKLSVMNDAGVEQKLGNLLPGDATFVDENGKEVKLKQYFGGRPILLMPVYFECPMLCTLSLNQLSRSLTALPESAGERFDILTVSFDPRETTELAAEKKKNYLRSYRRPSAEDGWHFLTGKQESIDQLMQAIGFKYKWDEQQQQFAHAAALLVITPEGKISQYFLGVDYPPTEIRSAVDAASAGTVGKKVDEVFLYCFKYDPATGKYGLIVNRALKVMGIATVMGLIGLMVSLSFVRSRRMARLGLQDGLTRHTASPDADSPEAGSTNAGSTDPAKAAKE